MCEREKGEGVPVCVREKGEGGCWCVCERGGKVLENDLRKFWI